MKKLFTVFFFYFSISVFFFNLSEAEEIEILSEVPGTGEMIKNHFKVSVNYRGFLEDGTEFDNSFKRNEPFTFQIGTRQVIPGWDFGIKGMRVGGKRTLKIPPVYAYGKTGMGDIIPPNSTLIFEVEVLSVKLPGYKIINSDELISMNDEDLIIIDIRSKEDWETTGIIKNSKKISTFDKKGNFLPTFLDSLQNIANAKTKIVFVSKSGDISAILANGFVEHLGYKHIFSLKGGVQEWISLNHPVIR